MDSMTPSATQGELANQLSAITAVRELYEGHYVRLVRLAVLLIGDVGRAEEIVQDAFVDLVARWRTIRDPGAAASYLRTCVANGGSFPSAASCGGQSTASEAAVGGEQRGDGGAGPDRA